MIELRCIADPVTLLRLHGPSRRELLVAPPRFEVDGRSVCGALAEVNEERSARRLANGATERVFAGPLAADRSLRLRVVVRAAPDSPVVRFRYELLGPTDRRLTKTSGRDAITYLSWTLPERSAATEVCFGEFRESVHAFCLSERPVRDSHFDHELALIGPMLVATGGGTSMLLAYEHGSQAPDAFLHFQLRRDRVVELCAVKGNYFAGQPLHPDRGFATVWLQAAMVDGDEAAMACAYRDFVLRYQAEHAASRGPLVYYNTWCLQERSRHWEGKTYLAPMNQRRILQEIEAAHRIGVEVFVLDAGWFEKTGDWRVSTGRFDEDLRTVRAALDERGMKLGLWFDQSAALSSRMLESHRDCVMTRDGKPDEPRAIWETEPAHRLCLVSRYADAFADQLIRLHRQTGVSYFKWDAIDQSGCDDPGHRHGTADNSRQERADCYGFEVGRAMIRIVEKLAEACPEAVVDFDVTEGGRFMGLGFLAVGRYFLINNGPYYPNLDVPYDWSTGRLLGDRQTWSNILVYPGPARTWFCREPLSFDKWVPSTLLLTHYLPDDPADSRLVNIASLILGQNGLWGDLLSVSPQGVAHIAEWLELYKQVREDMAHAPPVRSGAVGGSPEVHEKIHPATGRGAVVIFASAPGTYDYITDHPVATPFWSTPGAAAAIDAKGRARITATFERWGAQVVFFGARTKP